MCGQSVVSILFNIPWYGLLLHLLLWYRPAFHTLAQLPVNHRSLFLYYIHIVIIRPQVHRRNPETQKNMLPVSQIIIFLSYYFCWQRYLISGRRRKYYDTDSFQIWEILNIVLEKIILLSRIKQSLLHFCRSYLKTELFMLPPKVTSCFQSLNSKQKRTVIII